MQSFDVQCRGGIFGYEDGGWRTLGAINGVLPGWRPERLYTGQFLSIDLLLWRSDVAVGFWFLDAKKQYLAGRLLDLPAWERTQVVTAISRHAVAIVSAAVIGNAAPAFGQLDPQLVDALLQEWLAGEQVGTVVRLAVDAVDDFPFLAQTFAPENARIVIGEHGEATLSIVNPRNGVQVVLSHSLCLDDFLFICPVPGEPGLFLARAGHKSSFVALYDADTGILSVCEDVDRRWMAPHYFKTFEALLFRHFTDYREALSRYFTQPSVRLASVMRSPPHLGHQLYNELGGLEQILKEIEAAPTASIRPPAVVVIEGERSEVYGPTEDLFPELLGCVERWSASDWREAVYSARLCALRLTTEYVSRALRTRITCRASTSPHVAADRELALHMKTVRQPVILFGLRVENRTVADLPTFLAEFATELKQTWPDALLVIDGHNAKTAGSNEVYSSWLACRIDPYEYEQELVADLARHCEQIGLGYLDLVGAVMERSVLWSTHATAFVTPWGAGLAKYRWLGNRPGVILSNTWNVAHRVDFSIYSDPSFMEDPSRVVLLDPAKVTDDPDMSTLIMEHPADQPAEGSMNFRVKIKDVIDALKEIMPRGAGEHRHAS